MARPALLALLAAGLYGCNGDLVNLGASEPLVTGGSSGSAGQGTAGSNVPGGSAGAPSSTWQPPVLLVPQEENLLLSNPTLTRDEKFLYYTEQLDAAQLNIDYSPVGVFRRTAQGDAWVERTEVNLGPEQVDVASPAISLDGDELWFGQTVPEGTGGTDIWLSLLDGQMPEHAETPLNSTADDAPRPVGGGGLLMPVQSRRHGGSRYQIYLFSRVAPDSDEWHPVDATLLRAINSDAFVSVDGFLTEDGLTLYFSSNREPAGGYDLYVARRSSLLAPFGEPLPLAGVNVNTTADERSPWVSPGGERLYFASNRSTPDYEQWALYRSDKAP